MFSFKGPIEKDPNDIFNYCTKYLIRDRSNESEDNSRPTEGWRFPLVMTKLHEEEKNVGKLNEVTFVYKQSKVEDVKQVELIGSFLPLYKKLPLKPLTFMGAPSGLYYLTVILPVGKGYYYRYLVNGQSKLDPINPQKTMFKHGKEWSFFFTDYFNYSNDFEEWEMNLLQRLVQQIALFRTEEAQNFVNRFYQGLPRGEKDAMPIYKLDESVGEINYITNILAREERHHLQDYKICIKLIDQVLRQRNPVVNSWQVSEELINDLYEQMANGNVPGWDYQQYNDPKYFIKLIRRHSITGAFCHPRHGGNIGCAGWNYLKEKYSIKDETGQTIGTHFNWALSIEKPFGKNENYLG